MTEYDLIVAMLQHPAGFEISLFGGLLGIRVLENGGYLVYVETALTGERIEKAEFSAEDVGAAADYFITERQARQLGYDFENYTSPPEPLSED